jgi:DedD protein
MNDHHLDDLIIGDPEPGSNRSKTLLTVIALAIVVMIIALILWALLSGSSDQKNTASLQTQETKPLAPDLIPLDSSNKEINVNKPTTKPVKPKQTQTAKPAKITQPTTQTVQKPVVKPAQKPVEISAPQTATPGKDLAASTDTNKKASTKPAEVIIKNANKTIYYIQVGAFKRDPSPKFIKKLKENGFTFITKTSKGIRRVRVGPYDGYQDAKAALPDIKAKLGVDGLIVKY